MWGPCGCVSTSRPFGSVGPVGRVRPSGHVGPSGHIGQSGRVEPSSLVGLFGSVLTLKRMVWLSRSLCRERFE